eukprot:524907-Prymnesium_polylepis.1
MWPLAAAIVAFAPVLSPDAAHRCTRTPQAHPLLVMRAEEPARERAPWVRRVQSVGTALATAV